MEFDNDIIQTVKNAIERKSYRMTHHALDRLRTRKILFEEVKELLLSGEAFLEKNKCSFDDKNNNWKYALKGTTIEGNIIRVVLSVATIEYKQIIIITVINLGK